MILTAHEIQLVQKGKSTDAFRSARARGKGFTQTKRAIQRVQHKRTDGTKRRLCQLAKAASEFLKKGAMHD